MRGGNEHGEVAIAGAGIIGLATALELADAGFLVTVFDRGRSMEASSWAAAGMLAVDDPENAPELHPFSRWSWSLYPAFLERIELLSGMPVPLRTGETLQGLHARDAGAAPEKVPGLCSGGSGFSLQSSPRPSSPLRFSLLQEASLDPRDLCRALPLAAAAAGVVVREWTPVRAVLRSGERLTVELADGQRFRADHFVLAAGAWSGQIQLPDGCDLPAAPRKGQMLEVTLDEGPALPVVVRTPELYLVPRGDGRVVIGATVEHAGFDRSLDEAAGKRLWAAAATLWPPIARGRVTDQWTGLRPGLLPGIEDPLPAIGPLGERLWAATAHFRNGILLAPATARAVRALLLGEEPAVSLGGFSPQRFAREMAHGRS